MGLKSLLDGSAGKARLERARWIIDLAELQHLCLPARTWVTLTRDGAGEFARIWMRSRRWAGAPSDTPRRLAFLLQQRVRELVGLELAIETPETAEGCMRVHVGAPELRALVEVDVREAGALLHAFERSPDEEELEDVAPKPSALVRDYVDKESTLRWVSRRHGVGRMMLRKILLSARVKMRARGQRPIEDVRPPERVREALAAADEGRGVSEVARILVASRTTARRFLARHGKRTGAPERARSES